MIEGFEERLNEVSLCRGVMRRHRLAVLSRPALRRGEVFKKAMHEA